MQHHPTFQEPSRELDALAAEVVDAAFCVHRCLGPGFFESIYENALVIELEHRQLPVRRQVKIPIGFRGHDLGSVWLDLLGLLINFNVGLLKQGIRRVVWAS